MSALQDKTVSPPSLTDAMDILKRDVMVSLNCCRIGQIQSFNGTTRTADVAILGKRVVPDPDGVDGTSIIDYPVLHDVPVVTLQGGGAFVQFPIAAGDQCVLLFSDRDIDAWFSTGGAQQPMSPRTHDFSDAICIVGLNAQTSPQAAYVANQANIIYGTAAVSLQSAKTSVAFGSTVLTLQSNAMTLTDGAAHMDFNAALVRIANNTTSLLTLLQNLATVLDGLSTVVGGGPLNAASITAINAWATSLQGLLYT